MPTYETQVSKRENCTKDSYFQSVKTYKRFEILYRKYKTELSIVHLVEFLVGDLLICLLIVVEVPIDIETHVVTSLISNFIDLVSHFEGAHRDRIYDRAFTSIHLCTKKNNAFVCLDVQEWKKFQSD